MSYELIEKTGEPGAMYFALGGQLVHGIVTKIAERAIELNDETLLGLLDRLKMVEKGE